MRTNQTFVIALVGGLITLALVCRASILSTLKNGETHINSASPVRLAGEWGPRINLRAAPDTYREYPQTTMRPQPSANGWWITPIHVNLLPKGDILITGWARVQEKDCDVHGGRQWPATFVLRVRDGENVPEGASEGSLYVSLIDEQPEMRGGENPMDPVDVLYCSGHVPLSDGRVLFTGGARYTNLEFESFDASKPGAYEDEYGLDYTRIFNPRTNEFTRVTARFPLGPSIDEIKKIADAASSAQRVSERQWASDTYKTGMMWYPTNTRLPGNRVLVTGGFARQSGPSDPQFPNRGVAIFDAASDAWTPLVAHKELPAGNDSMDPTEVLDLFGFDYAHNFLLPESVKVGTHDFHVALMGGVKGRYGLLSLDTSLPEAQRIIVPPSGEGFGPSRPRDGSQEDPGAGDTTGAILPSGEIVMVGGGIDGKSGGQRIDVYNPYTNSWRKPVYTGISRVRAAAILLPDGNIIIVNGEEHWKPETNLGDRRRPVLFDPSTGQVTILNAWTDDESDRGYHSFAILLQDGRILLGGGRELVKSVANGKEVHRIGCERPDLRIYSPPYLFKGPRPIIEVKADQSLSMRIKGAPIEIPYDGPALKANGGIVLMALGAETHHFDQNQRMVILQYDKTPHNLRITPPDSELVAPEGNYNLFFVSDQGVPSVGIGVHLEGR